MARLLGSICLFDGKESPLKKDDTQ
jgi:hypothetical protein